MANSKLEAFNKVNKQVRAKLNTSKKDEKGEQDIPASSSKLEAFNKVNGQVRAKLNKQNTSTTTVQPTKSYSELLNGERAKHIGFDTFNTDMQNTNKLLTDAMGGWQSPETMSQTKAAAEDMYKRLGSYITYDNFVKGGQANSDAVKLREEYKKAIDGWDDRTNYYGLYKDADSYSKEQEALNKLYSMSTADIEKIPGYKTNSTAYITATGEKIKWQDLYEETALKEYEQGIDGKYDINKHGAYEVKEKPYEFNDLLGNYNITDYNDFVYNLVNGDEDTITAAEFYDNKNKMDFERLKYASEEEKKRFNTIWVVEGEDAAIEYANKLEKALRSRYVTAENKRWADMAKEDPIGSSIFSVGDKLVNALPESIGVAIDSATGGEIDPNSPFYESSRRVATTRGTVSDMIGNDVGKFFYGAGMSLADNVAAMAVGGFGKLGAVSKFAQTTIMSSGSFTQTTLNAKTRGLSDEQALSLGAIAGAAEMVFESKSFDKLFGGENLSKGAMNYFIDNMKTELIGELGTELTNDVADFLIAQDMSQWSESIAAYQRQGMSQKEALQHTIGDNLLKYAEVAGTTFLTSGVISGTSSISMQMDNTTIGKTLRGSDQVSTMFDLAASAPESSQLLEAYQYLVEKGITAENITDSQLGNLYRIARTEAYTGMDKANKDKAKVERVVGKQVDIVASDKSDAKKQKAQNKVDKVADSYANANTRIGQYGEMQTKLAEIDYAVNQRRSNSSQNSAGASVSDSAPLSPTTTTPNPNAPKTELEVKEEAVTDAAYKAGRANVAMEQVADILDTPEKVEAYNRGRGEYIANMNSDTSNRNNIDNSQKMEYTENEVPESETLKPKWGEGMSGQEGYSYFDSLTEDDGRIHKATVNGITITIQTSAFENSAGNYKVFTNFNNGDKVTSWNVAQDFQTFEEAKDYAAMLSYEAADYEGGLTPLDQYYGKTESGIEQINTAEADGESNEVASSENSESLSNALAKIEEIETKKREVMARFGLSIDEADAVVEYKTAESYKINAKLREDETSLNEYQKEIVKHLDSALEKLPKHIGKVYRTVSFDDMLNAEEEYNAFIQQHTEGSFVRYGAYTSTSSKIDGHPMPDNTKFGVTLEIEGENGRDVEGFGNNFEKEVVYPRGLRFVVTEVSTDNKGRPYIKIKEIQNDGRLETPTEKHGNILQQVQTSGELHSDLHEVSEWNTRQGGNSENPVQGVRTDNESIKENHETLTLKHTKSIYSLFKGSSRVVVGKDIILTSDIAISLTDNALDEVKKVVDENNIEMGSTASFDRLGINDNDVVISGNPKFGEIVNRGVKENVYVFKIGDEYYVCQQKHLEAFNNGENIIKANKDKRKSWAVIDKNNAIVGAFLPVSYASVTDEQYNSLQSVSDALEAKKAKKAAQKNAPFSSTEINLLCSQPKLITFSMGGRQFVTDGVLAIKVDSSTIDYIKSAYKSKADRTVATDNNLGKRVEELTKNVVGEVSQTVSDDITETSKNGKTKVKYHRTACIVGNAAIPFNTKFYDILHKRSSTIKISSGGNYSNTVATGYDSNGEFVGFVFPLKPAEGSYVDVDGKQIPYTLNIEKESSKPATKEKATTKETPKKSTTKVVETTAKLDDFGEKIGGARKDQWSSRGLLVDDLDGMNDRERDKNVKKDNVWKRPNYKALVESGGDRGLLWAVNEIRKSLQQNVYYGYNATDETKIAKQKLFVETIRAIQSMAENAKTQADFAAMGEKWLLDNGYLEDTGRTYGRYAYTKKYTDNPALGGSNYLSNIRYLASNFNNLTKLADRNQFAVDTKSAVPKGFSIVGGEGSVGGKLNKNGEWEKDTSYSVAKGIFIIKSGFATREEALEWLKQGIAKKKSKTRFVPQQLLEVHRKGADYRNSKNVDGQAYIDTFGFKGGEFGNWMSAKDRQVSLDYGFDALKDLADALGIEDTDISFDGKLNIAFGARGQGLSGAAAHYENERRVINLTKMHGAGSLAHEWFHALDDFIGGYTNAFATDKHSALPERTKQAIRDLITTMQYKDATQEETDLASQKRYEQAVRGIKYTLETEFRWVEAVEKGTFKETDARYFKRIPTAEDAKKYRELVDKLLETAESKYVEELSNLRKEVTGRVIPKETRDGFFWRLNNLKLSQEAPVQRARKRTDFYNDSSRFGQLFSKDGDYWDSTVEMSARAFACYVADKTNKQNDYLSAHSDSAVTLDIDKEGKAVVVRAYPFGEERTAINKAFDNLVEALKADGFLHERTQTEKPAEVDYMKGENSRKAAKNRSGNSDKFEEDKATDKLAMWTTTRVNNEVKPKSISEIVATIEHEFGLNITTGHIRGKGVQGTYTPNNRGIKTKIANNLPVISHELGHYFERTLDIKAQLNDDLMKELKAQLGDEFAANYTDEQLIREGVAEYVRRFLQNRETAAIDYPKFNDFFLKLLPSKDLAKLQQLADDINAYYSLDVDTATSSIRLAEEGFDLRTPVEKLKDTGNSLYQAWVDSNYSIKRFDRETGSNAYMYASNAAYSDAIAGQIIAGDLTDKNGQYISSGLKTALHGINLNNKDEYRLFNEYLIVKHAPERLREGMRVFADDRKNNTAFAERRQAELESQYPQFKEASERLYTFIKQFYKAWGVDTGLISKEALESWGERWEYYVPFNRAINKGKGGFGAKRGFANQNSTLKKARGGGQDIIAPVDNLIRNIVTLVNAGTRNNVMAVITDNAEKLGADATFLEKVPMPITATKMDLTGVKDKLTSWLEESDMDADSKDKASGIVNNLEDVLLQYGRGKAHGNVVTVLKGGVPQAWKINDAGLLESLTSLSPKTMDGILDAYAVASRFMTANITGNNLIWSIFSNLPRDFATFFTYSKNKNVAKMAKGVGSAYLNKVKGDKADPMFKEFLAMGGGKTSAYTADRDLAKKSRKTLAGKKLDLNPLHMIGYVSDLIEVGPRYATYKLMRQAGMSPQEAFYEAMDITVNFRRAGRVSRELNKVVPFFNATVQGLDKFRRWLTLSELTGAERKKAIRSRTIAFVAISAVFGALQYALNNGDEEREKDYEQLSTYTKNTYWVIPTGDGKFFAIPKPREIAVLSSFFERCLEYGVGENDHAFDGYYEYASENFLPAIANDIAQIPEKGWVETGMNVIGSFGLIGIFGYMGANRDFLGRPIVASGLQNLEKKDQYTDRTSWIAYWLGQAFNESPEQIDYFFQQILGGWWKGQKALFPVGEKNVDLTLGVANTYVKDNQYSTDLTNWLYDYADKTAKAKNSNPTDIEKAITAKWASNMTNFYGSYYKKAKNTTTTATRSTRQLVLDMIREYQKGIDANYKTSLQEAVEAVCVTKKSTEYLPSVMPAEVTDGNDQKHTLSDVQYVEYQTDYLRIYWETVEDTMSANMTTSQKAYILEAAKNVAREKATANTLNRIGAPTTKFAKAYEGVDNDDLTAFLAGVAEANSDNSVKKSEVVDVITGMDIDNDDAWTLYLSKYDSNTAFDAYEKGINADLFMTAVVELDNIYGNYRYNGKVVDGKSLTKDQRAEAKLITDSRRQKVEKYLESLCGGKNREYWFLLGTEFESVKDDRSYLKYVGK